VNDFVGMGERKHVRPSPGNLQRVGVLACIPDLLRNFGVSPPEVLAAAGASAQALDNPDATIPYSVVGRLMDVSARKTRCPHFGLELGKRIQTASLGLVGDLMRNASTLGRALRDFADHHHRRAHGSVVYLLTDKHTAFFGYAVYQPNIPGNQLICDCVAMGGFNIVRELAGPGHEKSIEVLFSRSEPRDLTPYHRAFGVKLRFDAGQTAILLPELLLDHPVAGADAALRKVLEKQVAAIWSAGGMDIVTRLRQVLRIALISGQLSTDQICVQMGTSRRTLHRRLGHCGYKFQEILDETRCEFAEQLLSNTRLDIAEIATIVGYADPSVLTRSFVRWTGVPPREWRLNSDHTRSEMSTHSLAQS
jgi:AraC-like DNA-binding protein